MKKILIALLLVIGLGATAQTSKVVMLKSTTTAKTLDTVTNTGTRIQRLQIPSYNDVVTVQPTFTKISGTAGGTVTLMGSVDNVAYSAIGSAYTVTDTATQTTSFSVNPSIYQYYQLRYVGTGTMAVSFSTPVLYRAK
jgi:hypothetical protein